MRRLLSALLLCLLWAAPAWAVCNPAGPAWTLSNRPSTPNDQTTGYNTTTGYCETWSAAQGIWMPQIIDVRTISIGDYITRIGQQRYALASANGIVTHC